MRDSLKQMEGLNADGTSRVYLVITKPLARILVKYFTQNVKASLEEGRPSANLLTSIDIQVHKGGDRCNWVSYRSVSLTPIMLETLESFLRDRIVKRG